HQRGLSTKLSDAFDKYQRDAKGFVESPGNVARRLAEATKLQDAGGIVNDPHAVAEAVPENIRNLQAKTDANVDALFTKPEEAEVKAEPVVGAPVVKPEDVKPQL